MRYLKFSRLVGVALVGLLSFAVHAEPIQLVSGNDYAPYAGSKLKDGGLVTELVRKAFLQVGKEANLTWLPWARGFAETKKGGFAATFPYSKTEERARDMLFSDPIVSLQLRVFAKGGVSKFDFSQLSGFVGSTMCLSSGATAHPKLIAMLQTGQLKRFAPMDMSVCILLVNSGEADFFVMEERVGRAALAASGLEPGAVVLADVPPLSSSDLYLVAPKHVDASKEVIEQFNRGLDELRKNGTYDQVVKAHVK